MVIYTCDVTRIWGKLLNLRNLSLFATRWDKISNKAGSINGEDGAWPQAMTPEQMGTHDLTVFKRCPGIRGSRQGGLSLETGIDAYAVKTVPEA